MTPWDPGHAFRDPELYQPRAATCRAAGVVIGSPALMGECSDAQVDHRVPGSRARDRPSSTPEVAREFPPPARPRRARRSVPRRVSGSSARRLRQDAGTAARPGAGPAPGAGPGTASRRGARAGRRRGDEASRRRGVRLRVSADRHRRDPPGADRAYAFEHLPASPHAGRRDDGDARTNPNADVLVFAGLARPVEGAGGAVDSGRAQPLLPDRAARCLDERRRLVRQAHARRGERRSRDRRAALEGHAARRRVRSEVTDRAGLAVRPPAARRSQRSRLRAQGPGPDQAHAAVAVRQARRQGGAVRRAGRGRRGEGPAARPGRRDGRGDVLHARGDAAARQPACEGRCADGREDEAPRHRRGPAVRRREARPAGRDERDRGREVGA